MCRMFGYVGDSRKDLERLVEALCMSAKKDTVAASLGMDTVHADGWGYALYSDSGLSVRKSRRPVFEDDVDLPPTDGRIYAIFHARMATDKKMVESRFSHPYCGDDESSFVFLAHNGSVDKGRLQQKVGFSGRATDSELAMKYLLRFGLGRASELERYTTPNSALNLMVLSVGRNGGARVLVKHFYNKVDGRKDKSRYYAIYHERLSGGKAAFSSTFNDYGFSGTELKRPGLLSVSGL